LEHSKSLCIVIAGRAEVVPFRWKIGWSYCLTN
jgi:hypothetical protein